MVGGIVPDITGEESSVVLASFLLVVAVIAFGASRVLVSEKKDLLLLLRRREAASELSTEVVEVGLLALVPPFLVSRYTSRQMGHRV